MTALGAFDVGLAVLVIGVAGWSIVVRAAFAAVVGYVAYGLVLSLIWVRLSAADVALTEVAIGSGATGMLLLVAAGRWGPGESGTRPGLGLRVAVGVLCALVAAGLAWVVLMPVGRAPSLAAEAAGAMGALGVGNPVTAVLLAYRAFDTLMEGVVLLLALVGVWSLAPDQFWGGRADLRDPALSGGVLAFLAQVLAPVGIVVAVYMFWVGADLPGGKFQAGTILAAMWVLAMLAGFGTAPEIGRRWVRSVLVIGPAVFLLVGVAGFAAPGVFLGYPAGLAKPLIVLIEAAMMASIAATLGLLVAGPPTRAKGDGGG